MKNSYEKYSVHRIVIGGKDYENGNYCWIGSPRNIYVEFNSDYCFRKVITAKNWLKKAIKELNEIPQIVEPIWFKEHGWFVPDEVLA